MINEVIFRAEPVLNWKLKAWGSAYNADIHREFNKVSSRVCMSIAPSGPNASLADGDNVYMVVDKSGQISQVAQCTVYPVEHLTGLGLGADEYVMGDEDRFVVIIDRPFKFIFVADLIAEIYPKFSAMDVKLKALYKHELEWQWSLLDDGGRDDGNERCQRGIFFATASEGKEFLQVIPDPPRLKKKPRPEPSAHAPAPPRAPHPPFAGSRGGQASSSSSSHGCGPPPLPPPPAPHDAVQEALSSAS
jgi:hypothetical protein